MYAAQERDNTAGVNLLLANEADVHARDREGKTPLMYAAQQWGNIEIVKSLLANEADVHARDKKGKTPLILAAAKGNGRIVKLLLEQGADVNAKDREGKTALQRGVNYPASWVTNIIFKFYFENEKILTDLLQQYNTMRKEQGVEDTVQIEDIREMLENRNAPFEALSSSSPSLPLYPSNSKASLGSPTCPLSHSKSH